MGDKLANVFAMLSSGMLAGAGEAAKNVIFFLWIDGPHFIVDFGVTVEIGSHHCATQHAGKAALVGSRIPFDPDSGHCLRC